MNVSELERLNQEIQENNESLKFSLHKLEQELLKLQEILRGFKL